MKLWFQSKKPSGGFNLKNLQGNISLIESKFIQQITLILLLPHVVLIGVTTRSSISTNSSTMKLLHTSSPYCNSEISIQRFGLATQTLQFVTLRSPLKNLDQQLWLTECGNFTL